MKIALYGGSFNPPHPAHVRAARLAFEQLAPDKLIVMPAAEPPHKRLPELSPSPEERLLLTRIAFRDLPQAKVSDMEISRSGESYTSDTVRQLMEEYPGAELTLIVGSDMLLYFEKWHEARWLLENVSLAALSREQSDARELEDYADSLKERFGARITVLSAAPLPMSSSEIRRMLADRQGAQTLDPEVYARIIKVRDYGAKPEFEWLRRQAYSYLKPGRIPHVAGCEKQAVELARRWGADEQSAAEAAILHDITKKLDTDEQLILCDRYGIIADRLERESKKLLHARTGAALSRELFGIPDDIYEAIRWHTTGKPDMTLLEKVVYMADYIEPTRDFEGVEQLRSLASEDLDAAMVMGLRMCLEELRGYNAEPHPITVEALRYYEKERSQE